VLSTIINLVFDIKKILAQGSGQQKSHAQPKGVKNFSSFRKIDNELSEVLLQTAAYM